MANNVSGLILDLNQVKNQQQQPEYSKSLEKALKQLQVPEGYALKKVQSQKQNNDDVWIFRYEKESGENNGLGGEHFSFVVNKKNDKILGFTWMDQSLSTGGLPSKEETEAVAKAFLDTVEPGLFERLKNLWIDKHDETFSVADIKNQNHNITVSGMKYKCYLKEQDNYAWVIVAPGGKIITFEQEIIWNNGRVTEKWLHDSRIKNK
jgi:hypothetical protein